MTWLDLVLIFVCVFTGVAVASAALLILLKTDSGGKP
jgi:hypothetical protein